MDYVYQLRICSGDYLVVANILGLPVISQSHLGVVIELNEASDDPVIDYVCEFLRILDSNYDALSDIGVERSDISVWVLGEYQNECNFEIDAENLAALGNEGISLCLSFWKADERVVF